MDLEAERAAGRNPLCGAFRIDARHVTGGVAAEVAEAIGTAPARLPRRVDVDDDVMDNAVVARDGLGRLHPHVLREVRRHRDIHVGHRPLGGDGRRLGDLEDEVGGADRPALRKGPRRRFLPLAARRSVGHPRDQGRAVGGGEPPDVCKMAMARVGMPRGHAPILHDLTEHRRVGVGVVVREEREAADLTRPMA